jgi:hypothetical protein
MKITDQKENFPIVVLISLGNWKVNVVEYKVQELFLNEKEILNSFMSNCRKCFVHVVSV